MREQPPACPVFCTTGFIFNAVFIVSINIVQIGHGYINGATATHCGRRCQRYGAIIDQLNIANHLGCRFATCKAICITVGHPHIIRRPGSKPANDRCKR